MRRLFLFVTAKPVLVLAVAGVVALAMAACLLLLTRDLSADVFIPQGHPALGRKERVARDFGVSEPIVVAVIRDAPDGVFSPHTLQLIRDLTDAVRALPGVEPDDVLSIATESGIFFDDGEPAFELLMPSVPQTAEACRKVQDDVLGYELYRGTLVSRDSAAAAIVVRPHNGVDDAALYAALTKLLERFPVRDEHLIVAGEAAVRAHMGVAVSNDALRMNFICPAVMALLIILAYRTGRGFVLPMCVIGGAAALALGSMGAVGVPVYIVTNGIFVIIMALGVADSLHLLGQYYEEQLDLRGRNRRELIVDACQALWFPLLVTSLTDVAGFCALAVVGIMPPIRYFGLFTSVGVLGALLYSYTVVPAGLMLLPLKMSSAYRARPGAGDATSGLDVAGRFMGGLGAVTFRRPWYVVVPAVAVIAVAAWGAAQLVLNDARILAFKDHHPIVKASNELNARFDGTSQLNIVVTAARPGALLDAELLEKIDALEACSETLAHVGGTHSIAGWVKRAHQKMNQEDPAFYAIPEDRAETQFYLDTLNSPLSPMARSLREVIDADYTNANLIVRMTSSEYIAQRPVIAALQRYLDEEFNDSSVTAILAGRVDLDYHWVEMVRRSHINSVLFSFACVLLLTGLMFRSLVAGLLCTATVGVAVLANYAVMGAAGIPLGVGTSMFASIAIGAGVNFPIHILDRLRLGLADPAADPAEVFRQTLAFTGRALFFIALVVAVGFLLLCVSEFRTLVRFGLLVAVSMCLSFLTSVTLLPAVVRLLEPRCVWGRGRG